MLLPRILPTPPICIKMIPGPTSLQDPPARSLVANTENEDEFSGNFSCSNRPSLLTQGYELPCIIATSPSKSCFVHARCADRSSNHLAFLRQSQQAAELLVLPQSTPLPPAKHSALLLSLPHHAVRRYRRSSTSKQRGGIQIVLNLGIWRRLLSASYFPKQAPH